MGRTISATAAWLSANRANALQLMLMQCQDNPQLSLRNKHDDADAAAIARHAVTTMTVAPPTAVSPILIPIEARLPRSPRRGYLMLWLRAASLAGTSGKC